MKNSTDCRKACWSALRSGGLGRGRKAPGFLSLLALLFIGLKLTDHIDWSWLWVLSPIWLKFVILLPIILLIVYVKTRKGFEPSGET